ncbi:MAG: hypothetical protein V3U89_06555 [Methylophilaceae bacterium]
MLKTGLLIIFLLMTTPVWAFGVVENVVGNASALNQEGDARSLVKGRKLESRETIMTEEGAEVLIKTNDYGLLLLKPNSKLYIASYYMGGSKSQLVVRLLKGSVYGETGRIGHQSDAKNYRLLTSNADIKFNGAQYHVALKTVSTRLNTYVKVDKGHAKLSSRNISLTIVEQQLGVATGSEAPHLLVLTPDDLFAASKLNAEQQQLSEKNAKKVAAAFSRVSKVKADDKIASNCVADSPAQKVLDAFVKAYERGDVAYIQRRLDPSMIGYGALLNSMMKDVNVQKQTRFLIQNKNVQCGPNLAVVNFSWEKRYLDLLTFRPRLQTGQAAVLTHFKAGEWKLSGITGDNPFAPTLNKPTTLVVTPRTANLGAIGTGIVPVSSQITLVSESLAGAGVIQVQARTSSGDTETISLKESQLGVFIKNDFNVMQGVLASNDGVLHVLVNGATTTITFKYSNLKTGVVASSFIRLIAF